MKFVEYSFPELEDAAKFSEEDEATLIDEITQLNNYQNDLLEVLLEKKVFEVYQRHSIYIPLVNKIIVDARYEYNDEGYELEHAMIWFDNWNDPSMSVDRKQEKSFQKDLDLSLEKLAPLLTRATEIDVYALIAKFGNKEPEIKPEDQEFLNNLEKNKADFSAEAVTARSEEAHDETKKTKKRYQL